MHRSLPAEILLMISKHFHGIKDILMLALSCRSFSKLLIPDLYSSISFPQLWTSNPVISLVTGLLRRPEHARLVRRLELPSWNRTPNPKAKTSASEEKLLLLSVVADASRDEEEKGQWIKDLHIGLSDAWIAILLTQLPNLQQLSISFSSITFRGDVGYVSRLLQRAGSQSKPFNETHPFPHLTDVVLKHWNVGCRIPYGFIRPFLRFPSLKKLVVFQTDGDLFHEPDWIASEDTLAKRREAGEWVLLSPKSSGITHLSIEHSCCPNGFAEMIGVCKNLTSFRYSDGCSTASFDLSDPEKLHAALMGAKASLDTIWINCHHASSPDYENGRSRPMGSFSGFTALKRLKITLTCLIDLLDEETDVASLRSRLPVELQGLYLDDCTEEDLPHLTKQLEDLVQHSTHLNALVIQGSFDWTFEQDLQDGEVQYRIKEAVIMQTESLHVACEKRHIRFHLVAKSDLYNLYDFTLETAWETFRGRTVTLCKIISHPILLASTAARFLCSSDER